MPRKGISEQRVRRPASGRAIWGILLSQLRLPLSVGYTPLTCLPTLPNFHSRIVGSNDNSLSGWFTALTNEHKWALMAAVMVLQSAFVPPSVHPCRAKRVRAVITGRCWTASPSTVLWGAYTPSSVVPTAPRSRCSSCMGLQTEMSRTSIRYSRGTHEPRGRWFNVPLLKDKDIPDSCIQPFPGALVE